MAEKKINSQFTSQTANPPNNQEEFDFPPTEEEQQRERQQPHSKLDEMDITSRGVPPRVSRRQRSEFRNWNRAKEESQKGATGSKSRSTSRH